jgi:predicted CopG family antitoxin
MSQSKRGAMSRTTVSLQEETADELHALKERGDSYDDVVTRLIDHYKNDGGPV